MNERRDDPKDEAAIRALVEAWAAAVRRRDIGGILKDHAEDIVLFDVPPPFQSRGIAAYEASWGKFLSWSSDPVAFDIVAMSVTAGADVAFVVATMRCAGPGPDGGRESLDFRLTVGLRKIGGRWTVTHEHHSVPAED